MVFYIALEGNWFLILNFWIVPMNDLVTHSVVMLIVMVFVC